MKIYGLGTQYQNPGQQQGPLVDCKEYNIYFWLRFGLANTIDDYQRLKLRVVFVGNFLTFNAH